MSTANQRIERLQAKKAQLDAELARLSARARVDARKADTRRKILIGALIVQEMERRAEIDGWVRRLLAERLEKPRDRALFDLPPLGGDERSATQPGVTKT